MIVKPSISFLTNASDGKLIIDVSGILAAMKDNASFTSPSPSLADVTAALDAFSVALAAAKDGGKTLTAVKKEKRKALVTLLRQLASYVQVESNGDMAVLLS